MRSFAADVFGASLFVCASVPLRVMTARFHLCGHRSAEGALNEACDTVESTSEGAGILWGFFMRITKVSRLASRILGDCWSWGPSCCY